jgi:hypothetical protein
MLLGEEEDLFVQEGPVAGLFAEVDDLDEDAGCGGEV